MKNKRQTKKELMLEKYRPFYLKLSELVNDPEILPKDLDLEEFVSPKGWLGVAKDANYMGDLKKMLHLTIVLSFDGDRFAPTYNEVTLKLSFNGPKTLEKFTNLMSKDSKKEKIDFVNSVKGLSEYYKFELGHQDKRNFAASSKYEYGYVPCKDITPKGIEELLSKIKKIISKRDELNKTYKNPNKGYVAVVRINIIREDIKAGHWEEIKKAIIKLSELLKIANNIKSSSEIKKLEKENKKKIARL